MHLQCQRLLNTPKTITGLKSIHKCSISVLKLIEKFLFTLREKKKFLFKLNLSYIVKQVIIQII